MEPLKKIRIVFHSNAETMLACINHVIMQITDPVVHHMWCGQDFPVGVKLDRLEPGTEPVALWAALNEEGVQVGHGEIHHNRFGWVLGRLWIHENYRNRGLARKLWMKALDYAFQRAEEAGCFCNVQNVVSKKLHLSMGFRIYKSFPEEGLEYMRMNRAEYTRLKRSGRGKLSLAFARLPKIGSPKLSSQ